MVYFEDDNEDWHRMVDIQDRRYLAQCTQQLPSGALAELLDMLLTKHPSEVVERKGGESYHIDFGTLSTPAYAEVRNFVKNSLGYDDDFGFSDGNGSAGEALPGFGTLKGPEEEEEGKAQAKAESAQQTKKTSGNAELGAKAQVQQQGKQTEIETTPSLPRPSPSSAKSGSREPSSDDGSDVSSFSPESSTKIKRVRRSSEQDDGMKRDEISRYYNGERVWRHATQDLDFNFHGVDVKLLSLQTETKRPWQCAVCEKAFVSKDKIVNHVQQHSGEKIHECPICHGKFSSKHYLKEHQKRVHLFNCHHCEKSFDTFEELHKHSFERHPEQTGVRECSCKKGCNNSRCSCFKNGLNCSEQCQCHNCNNMA